MAASKAGGALTTARIVQAVLRACCSLKESPTKNILLFSNAAPNRRKLSLVPHKLGISSLYDGLEIEQPKRLPLS
tara:strand:+ start:320 stop:544 length:225 start_codon:yes stop_codon:yes gene_type:complete